jgi:hypothetical protein
MFCAVALGLKHVVTAIAQVYHQSLSSEKVVSTKTHAPLLLLARTLLLPLTTPAVAAAA